MANLYKSILIVIFLIASQLTVYFVFVEPTVSTWGATKEEALMPMAGDHITPYITSTRAIDIDAPKSESWRWLMQLGADRAGFFSYYFIEQALGYISRDPDNVKASYKDFKVGDIVRGSIEESKAIIPYNFPVLSVKAGESLVLDKWGTFNVVGLGEKKSRLIIRSHSMNHSSILSKIADKCLGVPLHFIMERRTLMGIKARVESGPGAKFSATNDMVWFAGILVSFLLIVALVFIFRNLSSIVVPFVLSTLWVVALFVVEPIPIYSLSLVVLVIATIAGKFLLKRKA